MEILAARIAQKINDLKLTQRELAARIGVPQTTLSQWLLNKNDPPATRVVDIAAALGVTPSWLLGAPDLPAPETATNGDVIKVLEWLVRIGAFVQYEDRLTPQSMEDTIRITMYNKDIPAYFKTCDLMKSTVTDKEQYETMRATLYEAVSRKPYVNKAF